MASVYHSYSIRNTSSESSSFRRLSVGRTHLDIGHVQHGTTLVADVLTATMQHAQVKKYRRALGCSHGHNATVVVDFVVVSLFKLALLHMRTKVHVGWPHVLSDIGQRHKVDNAKGWVCLVVSPFTRKQVGDVSVPVLSKGGEPSKQIGTVIIIVLFT